MGDPRNTYDISPKQQEIIKWKAARRQELRTSFLKQAMDPHFEGEPFDPAVQRFQTMRQRHEVIFKPTIKNFLWSFSVVVIPIALTYYLVKKSRDKHEHLYRTGQVSYRDREYKFT